MSKAALTISAEETLGTISPLVHGHFAEHLARCCYDGLWVGRDSAISNQGGFRTDVIEALKQIGIPQLRWPGGCFADSYHWREGIGPPDQRPRSLAESCGLNVVEDNGLGTHEFIAFCRAIGAEPYLAGNVGSGTPQEMMDWVHYCNGSQDTTLVRERAANGHPEPMNVRYWGVGNENWGCGGNYEAVDYAKEFKRYATFIKMMDQKVELVACGFNNRDWNLKVVETLRNHLGLLDHVSVHQYWTAGSATNFTEAEYYEGMQAAATVEEDIRFTDEILRFFVAGRRKVGIAFDEWGIWHPEANTGCDYEAPSTIRDAVVGAGILDVFHKWCGSVSMANLAQIVNVLQALIQTREDKMWVTPTYHLFRLYAPHRGGECLRTLITDSPTHEITAQNRGHGAVPGGALSLLSASASRKDGQVAISLSNRHRTEPMEVLVSLRGIQARNGALQTLSGDAATANSADEPNRVSVVESRLEMDGDTLRLTLPPCSVQTALLTLSA